MDAWGIKIGGSLYGSKYLVEWLKAIDHFANKNVIIVPGGGPFADQVRQADEKFSLPQEQAHNMALMAMQQYGTLLVSLCSSMIKANSKEEIYSAWKDSKIAIWEPYEMLRDNNEIEKSWNVTSDSLAVWLAQELELKNLILVKSSEKVIEEKNIESLTSSNCVDAKFNKFIKKAKINPHILHKSQISEFKNLIEHN